MSPNCQYLFYVWAKKFYLRSEVIYPHIFYICLCTKNATRKEGIDANNEKEIPDGRSPANRLVVGCCSGAAAGVWIVSGRDGKDRRGILPGYAAVCEPKPVVMVTQCER